MLYDYSLESEEQGLEGLESFLGSRSYWFAERLRWVALEKSEPNEPWNEPDADWEEVKRLFV